MGTAIPNGKGHFGEHAPDTPLVCLRVHCTLHGAHAATMWTVNIITVATCLYFRKWALSELDGDE